MNVLKTETTTLVVPSWSGISKNVLSLKINRPYNQVMALLDILKDSLKYNRSRFGGLAKRKITEPLEELETEVKVLRLLGLTLGQSILVLRQLIRELGLLP